MAEDFRIQVETDLDTSKAEQKLNALLKEKRQIKLDIDINNQNVKNISKNIEKGIKDTRIDTSAITKQLADSFNISDKSVLKNLNKQLNNMVSSLGKTWNGSKFDFGKATGFYSGLDGMAKTIATNSKLVKSATGYYDDFYNYFKNKKIYVSDDLKKALGGDNYKELLQNNIGKITKDAKKGISIDSLWGEMSNLFPEHFSQNITNQADQIIHVFDLVKKARQDMTQSMNFSELSANQKFDVTSSAYEQVVTMGKEVADKLKNNIQSATEASKTSIDLDVNVDKEKIASQIKEAIASAGNNASEAIKLDLQINDEQLLSNLRSSISKIASGDEPVKVDIDIDRNGLQEKLNSACYDMEIPVDFKIDSEDIASKIKAAVDGITDIELDLKVNTDSVKQAVDENLKKIEPEVDESRLTQLQQALHNVNTAGQQSQSVFSSLGSTFKEAFSAYSLANVMQDMLYKIADGAREAVGTVKELNDSITSLEMATGENYNTVKQMMSQYNEMGQELGSITTDIAEGADSWLRQGKSVQETNQLLKDSMVLSKVSDLSASDSTQYLTSAMNGYKVAAEDVMSIVDKVSQVDLYSATDAGGLMEAMSRVSTTANTAGVSMDKLLGYLATTGEVTQRSMSSIGESFKTIFARMSDIKAQNYELVDEDGTVELLSDVESSLKKVGIDLRKTVTEYNSYDDVLDNLAEKWSSLNQVQQNELSKAFAGVRQQEVFRTLMENYDRVKKYTKLAEDSAGTAEKKFNDNYLSSLEAKTQSLKASLESLSSSLISNDMYAGVLDGTKAIVDFTEKTQILKGTLAGLGTAGGIFAFQKIGSWVGEAVKEFSNLGTAMDMLKSGSVDTSGFKDLLSLTQNLSKSQTELVLSSTALTDAQRVAILTGQGMSASEAEAAVSAMGLSTANAAATTSTLSLGTAFKGLWATLMANPLILVATGVTAAVSAYSAYQQSVQESVSSAKEAGQKFSENTSSLQDNIAKVQELRSQLASGTLSESEAYQAKSDLLSIQNQLSDSYGSQAQGIDLVNGKLDEQISKMQSLAQEEAKKYLNEEKSGIDKAQSEMNKNRGYNLGTFSNWDIRSKDTKNTLEKVKDIADQIKGIDFGTDERGQGAIFKFTGKAENAEESINSFMDKVRDLKSEMQDNGQDTTFLDSILEQSSKSLKKNKDILDEYQDINKQALEAQMTSEGFGKNKPATVYDDYKNAVEKYNDALTSGDTSKIESAESAFNKVKESVNSVTKSYPEFKSLFDEVGESLDKSAVKAYDFQKALNDSSMKDVVSQFKDLQDVDLKGISFDDKTTAKGEEALKSVVDKAIELGIVSDDSAESVAKVVDMLTEMGLTGTVSVDALNESFSKAQTSIQQTMSDLDSMKSIMAESVTGSGISADNVKAFKEMFGDDASKALEQTANGYHINRKALAQLQEQQAQGTKTDYLSAIAEQQEALRKVNEQIAKAKFMDEDISGLQSQRQSIEDNISSLKDLAYQYQTATSAFQQWQDAMSGGEEGDMYDSIQGNLESAESLYEKGLTGTNKFREFVDLMSNKDLSMASNEDIVSAYEEAMPKIKRYFTEGQEGAQNFLSDIQNINKEWSHMNEDGSWEINFGAGNDQEIADALGIDVEAVQSIMRKLSDYGFDINLDQPVASLEELKSSAESAKEALDGMNDTSLDGINLDADSFSAVTDSIDKVKEYIQQIQDSDIEPEVKTEKLQNANAILEYLVEKQQELGSSDIEIGVNIDEVNSKITEAQSALDQFKNSDGVVDLSVEGAQQAADNLQSLLYQKEALQNSSVVLNVDASQVDGSVGNAISKLQEYQTAVNNLNAQTELQKAGVQIDTSDAQAKVQQLASQIQGIDAETKAKLGLDTSEFNAALSSVTNTKVDVKAGVNLDTSSLGTIQSMISAISPKMLVKAGVDKSQVDGYQPSDKNSKVKYKVDSSAVDAFKPANKNATVTYSVVVAGQVPGDKTRTLTYNIKTNGSVSPANGTAHSLGTAYAKGTTNVSSNGNWGLRKDEPRALVNELKPEIIVRDGEPFIVNGGDPAFTSLKKDDIVFNGEQSEALLKNGYVTGSHGKLAYEGGAHSLGSAFSSGTGKFNVKSSGSKANSTSSKKKNTSSSGAKSSGSSNKSSSNSSSDSSKDKTEEVIDWIEIYLNEMSRATEIAVDNIDRAIGLASKQAKAYEAIGKVQEEITANQRAADKYLAKANSVGLNETYASKVRNGTLDIETITDEDLKKKIDDYKTYYKDYEDSLDKVRDLEDKLSDLAEKRLEIIEKEYDAIVDINDAIKDVADSKMELNDALGTAVDNGDNISNLNKSIKAQEDTYNQLTKKLNEYQAEVNSQLSSGLLKQGSEAYQEAMKNIQDFSAKIYDASKELIELQDKLNQIKIDTIQNVIDAFERRTSKLDKYASLLEAQDKEVPESVYQEQIDTNNAQVQKNQEQRNLLLEQQSVYDVNSSRYKELAEDINKLDESTLGLLEDNEKLKDSIYELRISNLEKAIQGYDDLEDELKDFRSLLNDDAFLDKNGAITDEGLAQITLLSQSLGNVKKKISDLTTGLSKLTEMYNNGLISLDEYNDKSSEYRKEIRSATSDVKDYQDSLVSLYTDALKAEVDALDKVIDKRREAYKQQREYADYQKKVNSQQKDVNSIKAQIQAMENSSDAATLARVKKLKQDLADAEDDLNTTKQDHKDDLIDQGFQKLSDDLNQMLEDTEYEISHNADKQNEIIQSMLNKQVGMYQEAYSKINSIIKNTGWIGSNDFNNNQSQMSSQTGAQNQASNASQSQQTANRKPSSSASGTDTSGIKDNASKNDKITENIMKPENTTNRPVAELTVSKSSVSIEEGKSTSVTTKIRPNDAANKKLSWKSSNTAIATVSNGTISGKKPGSCQITVSTTDGSGISKTIAVTVTKKPDPPKPAIPSNKGGDGVPRVGDVVTFNGKYYYDSWGKRPAGSLYSGVKNGVVIDSYSSRDYGGSARYTGDLKVHIKSADGRYGDLGWVRLSQISGYAKGTPGVDRDQIAIVDEEGRELQIPNGKGGRITKLEKGTGVIPHTATEKLMALSEQLDNNGNMVINGRTIEEYVNDMANMQSIAVPDFSDVTASVVGQLESKGMGNVMVENHYDSLLTVEGNVDKDTLPGLEDILKRSYEYTSKQMVKELRKGGMQIRR
jgi:TP901 family phage tail tape measure protein